MSNAKPMGEVSRASNYAVPMTPRQWGRWRHKFARAHGGHFGHWGDGTKGRPTPRQRKRGTS